MRARRPLSRPLPAPSRTSTRPLRGASPESRRRLHRPDKEISMTFGNATLRGGQTLLHDARMWDQLARWGVMGLVLAVVLTPP